jgi:hypothetical protein
MNRILTCLIFPAALVAQDAARIDAAAPFIGTWRLVTSEQRLANGTTRVSPAYGPHQLGYMIYTDTTHMCSVTVNADRPKWVSPGRPTEAELKSAWDGLGSYCATYTVNAEEKSVVHHVEFDKSPNAAGADRKRFFTFEGNRLVLKIDPKEFSGDVVENTIIWERVAK